MRGAGAGEVACGGGLGDGGGASGGGLGDGGRASGVGLGCGGGASGGGLVLTAVEQVEAGWVTVPFPRAVRGRRSLGQRAALQWRSCGGAFSPEAF